MNKNKENSTALERNKFIIDCLKETVNYCKEQYKTSCIERLPSTQLVQTEEDKFSMLEDFLSALETNRNEQSIELERLLKAADAQLGEQLSTTDDLSTFSIIVGGKCMTFVLGGVQSDALCIFAEYIANECGYEIDLKNLTVNEE